ncbi:class I SAM-dependent methyltransferase, partial [Cylindrospermopsis raciborskii CS-506_D]
SGANRVEFHHLSISDVDQIPGKFDLINSVGVLHHLPDPITGIQSLAGKLAPGGIMHIFVYGELGRWEIQLMQKAIALLQGSKRGDYGDGVQVGRKVFATLPENNRIVNREKARWSWENQKDECFADMYVHPQEIDYNIDSLFQLIDASGLEFVGFSNPGFWNLERLLGRAPELMARAQELSPREQYRLIELLDPEVAHYEFFLTSPPLEKSHWQDDHALLAAIPELNPCLDGFPSRCIFNYDYQIINLSPQELEFMEKCNGSQAISQILVESQVDLAGVRKLIEQQLLILSPNP